MPRCAARAHVRREHQFASKAKDKEARSDLSVSRKHPLGGRQTAPAGDLTTARQPGGAGRGAAGLKAQGGSAGPKVPGSEPQVGAEVRPSSQKPLSDHRGLGRRRCQRRRWGTQAPCGRLRAKPALQTQRKEPLVFTQRSLLHSSPRWFSSRHSSMSTQRAREASSWKPPGHSHTAPPGRGTQRPLTQRHSSESSSELSSSLGGFPSSRGLVSQKELLSLCDVGHWDPAPRGGHGRHWAPQPRPWRQQQSSKVRAGPAWGPAHMPSSPR